MEIRILSQVMDYLTRLTDLESTCLLTLTMVTPSSRQEQRELSTVTEVCGDTVSYLLELDCLCLYLHMKPSMLVNDQLQREDNNYESVTLCVVPRSC